MKKLLAMTALGVALVGCGSSVAGPSPTNPGFSTPRTAAANLPTPQEERMYGAHGIVATEGHDVELCYPKASWDNGTVDQSQRPCDLLGAMYEDGSGTLNLGTEGYELATCVIPNVKEERGAFAIECHRVPRR